MPLIAAYIRDRVYLYSDQLVGDELVITGYHHRDSLRQSVEMTISRPRKEDKLE